jgi:hypothetical protein
MAWWNSILSGIGAPQSQNNINKMAAWNWAEDTTNSVSALAWNNPFNTTLPMSGSRTCLVLNASGGGVQCYPSLQVGIAATVSTLLHSDPAYGYSKIVNNLRNNGSAAAFAAAVGSTPWGTSGINIGGKLATGGNMVPATGPGVGPTSGTAPASPGSGTQPVTAPPSGPTGGCVTYTPAQLAGIWIQAGGPPQVAAMAAAVAMAESSGNSCASNTNTSGSIDRGLWQMNSVYNASGSTFDVMTNARAAVALYKSSGNKFTAWCTAWNGGCCSCGTYLGPGSPALQFYNPNLQPDTTAPINPTQAVTPTGTPSSGTTVSTSAAQPATTASFWSTIWGTIKCATTPEKCIEAGIENAVDEIIGSILNPIIQIIAGLLGLAAGTVLMIVGLLIIASNTRTGRQLGQTAGRAGNLAMWAAGPEVGATSTIYESELGRTVTTRTPGRRPIMGIGGQPGRVTTQRQYADRAPTQQIYETPARGGGVQRTTLTRNYQQGRVASTKTTREVLRDEARKNNGNGNNNGNGSQP